MKQAETEKAEMKLNLEDLENRFRVCDETRTTVANDVYDLRTRLHEVESERQEMIRELQEALRQVRNRSL